MISRTPLRRPAARRAVATLSGLAITGCLLTAAYQVARPASAQARRQRTEIMPVDEIKPGMKGHAVTVFSGTQSDRFEIEIVDVVPDFVPGQPVILFRALDPRLQHSGVVGGMSGSPIYIDGKMIGALAYGWPFNKDPLGGITPIEPMLEVGQLPFRPEVMPVALGRDDRLGGRADSMLGLDTSPLPARAPARAAGVAAMTPLAVPMSLGGFGPRTAQFMGDQLGLVPAAGGSGGGQVATGEDKVPFKPGDSVSVVLIGGDNAAAPNGTVTWVGGKKGEEVLAFGHPLYGAGPSNFPVANARVHTIINSVQRSFKMSSPRHIQGTLIQDRQPAISLRTNLTAPTIPVTTAVGPAETGFAPRAYDSVVAVDPQLTPTLVASLMMNGLEEAAADQVELTAQLRHEIEVQTSRGRRVIKIQEELGFPAGVVPAPIFRSSGVQLVANALSNRFERAEVISVKQSATVDYGVPVYRVAEMRVAPSDPRPGDLLPIDVRLSHDRRPDLWRRVEVRIPDDVAGQTVQIKVAGSLSAAPPMPVLDDVDDLLDAVASAYPDRSLVISVFSPQQGLATAAGRIEDLPDSVFETLDPIATSSKAMATKRAAHRVVQTDDILYGEQTLTIEIGARRVDNP